MGQVLKGYGGSVLFASGVAVAISGGSPSSLTDAGDHKTFSSSSAKRYLDRSQAPTVQARVDDVQTVTISGSPTGGTFTLTFGGQTTTAIAYNATAATVQAALQALSSIGAGNVTVTGGPGPATPYIVEFTGTLGFALQAVMTAASSFTGGSSPTTTVAHTVPGFSWTTQAVANYSVQYVGGIVLFNSALSTTGTVQVQLTSGGYFTSSTLATVKMWELALKSNMVDVSAMTGYGGSAFEQYQPALVGGDAKVDIFAVDQTFFNIITGVSGAVNQVILSLNTGANATGSRYESYARIKGDSLKDDVKSVVEEGLEFTCDGTIYYFAS